MSDIGTSSGREYTTTLFCGSAVGERLNPYVVYKAETLDPSWTVVGGPTLLAVLDGWRLHNFMSGF